MPWLTESWNLRNWTVTESCEWSTKWEWTKSVKLCTWGLRVRIQYKCLGFSQCRSSSIFFNLSETHCCCCCCFMACVLERENVEREREKGSLRTSRLYSIRLNFLHSLVLSFPFYSFLSLPPPLKTWSQIPFHSRYAHAPCCWSSFIMMLSHHQYPCASVSSSLSLAHRCNVKLLLYPFFVILFTVVVPLQFNVCHVLCQLGGWLLSPNLKSVISLISFCVLNWFFFIR